MDLIALGTCQQHHQSDGYLNSGLEGGIGNEVSDGGVAESIIAAHRIISWQGLLKLKAEQLTSSKNARDGGFAGITGICVEDIKQECCSNNGNGNKAKEDDDNSLGVKSQGRRHISMLVSPVGLVVEGVLIHTVEPDAAAEASSSGGTLPALLTKSK